MARRSARKIYRSDGQRRIVITEAEDGLFRFIEQARRDIPPDVSFSGDRQRWGSLGQPGTICDAAEQAEKEAIAAIAWLSAQRKEPRT